MKKGKIVTLYTVEAKADYDRKPIDPAEGERLVILSAQAREAPKTYIFEYVEYFAFSRKAIDKDSDRIGLSEREAVEKYIRRQEKLELYQYNVILDIQETIKKIGERKEKAVSLLARLGKEEENE